MNKFLSTASSALVATALLAAPAYAQVGGGVTGGVGADLGIGGAGVGVDVGTTASTAANVGIDEAVSSLGSVTGKLQGLSRITAVKMVKVDASADADAQSKLEGRAAEIAALRSAISSHAELDAALKANNVDVSTVVGADVAADGSLTLYTL